MAPQPDRTTLGSILVERGIITEKQLTEAVRHAQQLGLKLGRAVVLMRLASEHQIEAALASQDHSRAASPEDRTAAVHRAVDAAFAMADEIERHLKDGADQARKITLNEDLDPIDASQKIGDD